MPTVVELLQAAWDRIDERQGALRDDGAREMALAKTAIEDAQMRFTRGMAKRREKFAPADLEK